MSRDLDGDRLATVGASVIRLPVGYNVIHGLLLLRLLRLLLLLQLLLRRRNGHTHGFRFLNDNAIIDLIIGHDDKLLIVLCYGRRSDQLRPDDATGGDRLRHEPLRLRLLLFNGHKDVVSGAHQLRRLIFAQ